MPAGTAPSHDVATPDWPGNTMETGIGSALLRLMVTTSPSVTIIVGPGYCITPGNGPESFDA